MHEKNTKTTLSFIMATVNIWNGTLHRNVMKTKATSKFFAARVQVRKLLESTFWATVQAK